MSVIPIQNRVGLFSNYIIDVIIRFLSNTIRLYPYIFSKYIIHVKILMYINEIFLISSNIIETAKKLTFLVIKRNVKYKLMCLNFIQGLISSCQQIQVGLDVEVNTRNNIKHRLRLQNSVFAHLEYKRERE